MSQINFQRLVLPADVTFLSEIWPAPYRQQFIEASLEWLAGDDPGEIFVVTHPLDGTIIGVTGWVPLGHNRAFLRWHGVLEVFRGHAYSTFILEKLFQRLKTHYYIHTVYELTEDKPLDYFLKMGFKPVRSQNTIDWLKKEAGEFKHVLELHLTSLPAQQGEQ